MQRIFFQAFIRHLGHFVINLRKPKKKGGGATTTMINDQLPALMRQGWPYFCMVSYYVLGINHVGIQPQFGLNQRAIQVK